MRQTMGYPHQDIPSAPPNDMQLTGRLTPQEVASAMLDTDVLLHLEEGDYATYRHTYLMPSLTGVRTPTRRSAGMPSSSRPQAADIPSTSRASTSRGGAGLVPPIPPTYHHAGWPDILTELMGWRYGTSYPISIEPPMPDHRYVSDPDSPPPPREYMEGMLDWWPYLRAWSCGGRHSCPSSVSRCLRYILSHRSGHLGLPGELGEGVRLATEADAEHLL
ncbi:uncharacterized protein LOC114277275 [Camellia sinensis]|uniref:uncharacterized protein LOC114277275 n=1 Tax=Camellia sinensis TaxID=4442 RepID=UPI0010361E58|nr:uncharacterized protein LOC114277275 [Camellia sinensis]XP_028074960.1 uncharacterized protein LOC114277275 [Camellia sinensis]